MAMEYREGGFMDTFELYFNDLTPNAQARLLEAAGIKHPSEMNWDNIFPITVLYFDDDDSYDDQ